MSNISHKTPYQENFVLDEPEAKSSPLYHLEENGIHHKKVIIQNN